MTTATMAQKAPRRPRPADVCRLTLTIRGIAYSVRPLDAPALGPGRRAWLVRKADGTAYHVAQHDHGAECDCADWTFKRDGLDPRGCKHIRALGAVGLLPSPEV